MFAHRKRIAFTCTHTYWLTLCQIKVFMCRQCVDVSVLFGDIIIWSSQTLFNRFWTIGNYWKQTIHVHVHVQIFKHVQVHIYMYNYVHVRNTHSESVVDSAEALQLRHNYSVGGGASWNILQFGQVVWCVDLYTHHMEFLCRVNTN